MRLLKDTIAGEMIRLDNMEQEASTLLAEQDTLDIRLHRACKAASLEALVVWLNMERKRILDEEAEAAYRNTLGGVGRLGARVASSFLTRQKINWDRTLSEAFPVKSFSDIRVKIASNNIVELVNISQLARERSITNAKVVAYLEEKDKQVLSWEEFEAIITDSKRAVLNGKHSPLLIS